MRISKLVLLFVFEQILIEKIRFKVTEGEICFATLYISVMKAEIYIVDSYYSDIPIKDKLDQDASHYNKNL